MWGNTSNMYYFSSIFFSRWARLSTACQSASNRIQDVSWGTSHLFFLHALGPFGWRGSSPVFLQRGSPSASTPTSIFHVYLKKTLCISFSISCFWWWQSSVWWAHMLWYLHHLFVSILITFPLGGLVSGRIFVWKTFWRILSCLVFTGIRYFYGLRFVLKYNFSQLQAWSLWFLYPIDYDFDTFFSFASFNLFSAYFLPFDVTFGLCHYFLHDVAGFLSKGFVKMPVLKTILEGPYKHLLIGVDNLDVIFVETSQVFMETFTRPWRIMKRLLVYIFMLLAENRCIIFLAKSW